MSLTINLEHPLYVGFKLVFREQTGVKYPLSETNHFRKKWMLYFWYLHQHPCNRLIHFQTKKYYLLHDKCFFLSRRNFVQICNCELCIRIDFGTYK